MSWAFLDDRFDEHPKVEAAGGDAAWLYVCGLLYVKRNNTHGLIPTSRVGRLSDRRNPAVLAARLVEVGLWETCPEGFRIHDFEEHNKQSIEKSQRARDAAKKRWGNAKPDQTVDAKAHANASAKADAASDVGHMQMQSPRTDARSTPSPNPISKSSSTTSRGLASKSEDEDSQIRRAKAKSEHEAEFRRGQNRVKALCDEAFTIIANRRLAERIKQPGVVGNTDAWLVKARKNAELEFSERAKYLAVSRDSVTGTRLANDLMREASSDPVERTQAATQVRVEEAQKETESMLAEPQNWESGKEALAAMRAGLVGDSEDRESA